MSKPMADAAPTVTVLMAVHDGQDFVREAVESVLAQTLRDLELLIIDDASTDSTPEILASLTDPRVRILTNSVNLGLTRSLNIGLREARGEFIARLDHDDAAAPDRFEKQLAFLSEHPDCVAVGCRLELRGEGEKSRLSPCCVDNLSIRWKLLFDTALPHPTLTMRASAVKAVGGYDEYFPCTMDYDLECRLARVGKLHNLPEPLVLYREHPGQMSAKRKNEQQYYKMQISCREMGLVLGRGPVEPRLQAHAEAVLTRGQLVRPCEAREAVTFSLRLARRFKELHHCPGFMSSQLEWILKEHVKFAALCLVRGRLGEALMRGWMALVLAQSGLVDKPLARVASAAAARLRLSGGPRGERHRRTVLMQTGWLGLQTEVWVYRQVTGLKRYRCHVVAYGHVNRRQFPYSPVHVLDHPKLLGHRRLQLSCALRSLHWPSTPYMHRWRLRRTVQKVRPDILHVQFLRNAPLAVAEAERLGIPLLVTSHGTDVHRARINEQYRGELQPVFERASRVIAVSDADVASLFSVGCPPEKVVRMDLGVPLPDSLADVAGASDCVRVACVAALREVKGHRYLLEAFRLARARDERLRLTLVGGGELRDQVEQQVRQLGLEDCVELTGWAEPDRVSRILASSHICAQHSVRAILRIKGFGLSWEEEGLPISLAEAASFGLPLVATRSGGIPEVCRHGENGFLVQERDVEGMADRILQLAADPGLRARMGAAGRALAERDFDIERQNARLESLYDEVLAEAGRMG